MTYLTILHFQYFDSRKTISTPNLKSKNVIPSKWVKMAMVYIEISFERRKSTIKCIRKKIKNKHKITLSNLRNKKHTHIFFSKGYNYIAKIKIILISITVNKIIDGLLSVDK